MMLLIVFIVSFLAFSISAICGGGAGIMLIPVLGQVLSVNQVPAALSIGTFTSSFSRIILFRKSVCLDIVKYFVPAALPAVILGAWLLKYLDLVYLEFVMGIFLVSNIHFLFRKEKVLDNTTKPPAAQIALIGFFAGFLSGLTGAVGLLFNRFYLRYGLTKEEIVATRAANEIVLHLIKLILYSLFGLMSTKVLVIGLVVASSAVFSSMAMKWILRLLSDRFFKKIGYSAMVLSGVVMLLNSGMALLSIKQVTSATELRAHSGYQLEFTFDEGFEFERIIPLSDLSAEQQYFVNNKLSGADEIVIEVVYRINKKSFEAYYFKDNQLIDKIHFS